MIDPDQERSIKAILHACEALDAKWPKRRAAKRDPIGTATLTMDEVDLTATYSYKRNIDPNGFDVFDITLTVKPNEALLDAVRDEIAYRLRLEEVAEREARADDGPEYEPNYDDWYARRMDRATGEL
jgi:hypothetical protein